MRDDQAESQSSTDVSGAAENQERTVSRIDVVAQPPDMLDLQAHGDDMTMHLTTTEEEAAELIEELEYVLNSNRPSNIATGGETLAHNQEELPPSIRSSLNDVDIKASRIEIVDFLAVNGPATTGEITEHVSLSSKVGVRRALYGLMSVDSRVDELEQPLVVKDRISGTYGLPLQIPDERSARGTVPVRPAERRTRLLDELIRRMYDVLGDEIETPREQIAEVVDRAPHQTRLMQRRGQAFEFPFEDWDDGDWDGYRDAAVIESIQTIAGATTNVSCQLVTQALVELLANNSEEELATALQSWNTNSSESPRKDEDTEPTQTLTCLDSETVSGTSSIQEHSVPSGDRIDSDTDRAQSTLPPVDEGDTEHTPPERAVEDVVSEALVEQVIKNSPTEAASDGSPAHEYHDGDTPSEEDR